MNVLRTENPEEKIIALDHIGTYRTPRGVIKVLVVTIREARATNNKTTYRTNRNY